MADRTGQGLTGSTTYVDAITTAQAPNYVVDTGASNALIVTLSTIDGSSVALAAGLQLLVKTANTLQVGANTLNFNGNGTKSIFNMGGRNLKTTTAAGAILSLVYDGTNFILLNSTY